MLLGLIILLLSPSHLEVDSSLSMLRRQKMHSGQVNSRLEERAMPRKIAWSSIAMPLCIFTTRYWKETAAASTLGVSCRRGSSFLSSDVTVRNSRAYR
jgi:hypothetical protein